MASLTVLAPTCVPPPRCIGLSSDHVYGGGGGGADGSPRLPASSGVFSGDSPRLFSGGGGMMVLRSTSSRVGGLGKVCAAYEPLVANPPFSRPDGGGDNSALKSELLSIVAGLDRGLLATASDETAADMAARKLEAAGEPVQLPRDLELLQGRWRLVFTSGFATGSLGGERPGPNLGRLLPLTLGQVYQRIDVATNELDNIVDLRIGTPWPLPPFEVTACLAHTFEVTSDNGIRIVFQKTTVKPSGGLSQLPSFDTPPLPEFLRQASASRGAGSFDTTYLDDDFRISRGDRGELRIFVRA